MTISIFDLFSIGIGPSSSHTVGPMRAAYAFTQQIMKQHPLNTIDCVNIELYGSLALTGKGHGTDKAVLLGLEGELPESIDSSTVEHRLDNIQQNQHLLLAGQHLINFVIENNLIFHYSQTLPHHSNGMKFIAKQHDKIIAEQIYYSIGGGFILTDKEIDNKQPPVDHSSAPYPFTSCQELLGICYTHNLSIVDVMMENEKTWRSEKEIHDGILNIAQVMFDSIERGCQQEGILPGGLRVPRRAPGIFKKLTNACDTSHHLDIINYINLYALAVNEENAAGGRIVTAPTNGAAGIIPAVLMYFKNFHHSVTDQKIIDFLLVSAAIGILYKKGASISAAEVGCQGEVGVACSMAAGALTAVLGGTKEQIENAAEIGMEHHLGLTCDPIAGLVQIPCIERNAMGAQQAIAAAQLALVGEGEHHISLDKVIATMMATGIDMQSRYKETSQGGLALSLPEC